MENPKIHKYPGCELSKDNIKLGCLTIFKVDAVVPSADADEAKTDMVKFTEKFMYIYDNMIYFFRTEDMIVDEEGFETAHP